MSDSTDPAVFQDDEDAMEGPDVEIPPGGETDPGNTPPSTTPELTETTDEDGTPVENPSG